MGNFGVLLVALLGLHYVAGQREIFPLTSAQQRELRFVHNPELLEVAARANENVFLRFRAAEMTVVVQENVNIFFDCLPWASNFPGGSIRWLIRSLRLDPVQGLVVRSDFAPAVNGSRIMIGGLPPLNRWLNLTGTIATEGAQDPDFGDYRCEVCVDRDRFPDTTGPNCHSSTTRLFIAGAPPNVQAGQDDTFVTSPLLGGRFVNTIQVGGDFCVEQDESDNYVITCDVEMVPAPVPDAYRIQWLKDGQEVGSFLRTGGDRIVNASFYAEGTGNEIFNPMAIRPPVLNFQTNDIEVDTFAFNVSMMSATLPMTLTTMEIRQRIVNALVGNWTCRASNIYGSDSESTIIRRCEGRPTFPGCPGGVSAIFPMSGSVVPIGCTICIPRGSSVILDCNAMTPSNILFYRWTVNGMNISTTNRRLRVTEEASYTCRATNLDFPNEMETSVLVFSTDLEFSARITNTAGGQVAGNGCNRLRDPVNADLCVLIGEQVNITCRNTETGALLNYTDINDNVFTSGSRTVNDATFESNYTCRLGSADECGRVGRSLSIRVFDPARVDRLTIPPLGSLGVGQFVEVQRPTIGDPVTLSCLTNGIDDPSTSWFRVNEASGCGVEEPITDGVTTTPEGDSSLLIADFQPENSGTYVCRTSNIAGRDAASIVLSSVGESTAWSTDNSFSECSLMCRDGIRTRSVSCRRSPGGRLRPVSECTDIMPAASETCGSLFPNECLLTPIFGVSSFGPCSRGCAGGHRERDVFCFVPMTRAVVDLDRCRRTGLQEPSRFDLCRNTCCVRDDHPACGRIYDMKRFCQFKQVQQLCCWACQEFIAYENTGDNTVDIVLG